jgi:hypothetical protein
MVDPISGATAAKTVWDAVRACVKLFWPTSLHLVRIQQRHWIGGVLTYSYTFRVEKPILSHSVSGRPIQMGIPVDLDVADLRLCIPAIKTDPISIPPSALLISARDLIGAYLGKVANGQELKVDLRIRYPQQDVISLSEEREANCKTIRIRNPHVFAVRSCDIERQIPLNEFIDEIQIIRGGEVVSSYRLFRLEKVFSLEFTGGDLKAFFPDGISVSADDWLSHERTEKRNCTLKFTADLEPETDIAIRFIYKT